MIIIIYLCGMLKHKISFLDSKKIKVAVMY